MLRAILVDDEKNALEVLELLLKRHCPQIETIALCDNGVKAINAINKLRPDVVFIDIDMPRKNGFEVLNETANTPYHVIFTTAYDQFAIKAFKYSAIDYLLKPIDATELKTAVDKILQSKGVPFSDSQLSQLAQLLQNNQSAINKIAVPIGEALHFIDTNEVVRCESESNYTRIFLANGKKITLAKTLKEIEESLKGTVFFRVHQSHLINMNHIKKYVRGENPHLVMTDGSVITISRSKKDAFWDAFRKI
jgi:two-component system LytT family response regulator